MVYAISISRNVWVRYRKGNEEQWSEHNLLTFLTIIHIMPSLFFLATNSCSENVFVQLQTSQFIFEHHIKTEMNKLLKLSIQRSEVIQEESKNQYSIPDFCATESPVGVIILKITRVLCLSSVMLCHRSLVSFEGWI